MPFESLPLDSPPLELWTLTTSSPRGADRRAERAEADGWHGQLMTDSQNLAGDVWISLASAATATTTLGLGTGVTNPVTRHPAATAAAAASLALIAGDRIALGIGRGDSALAHLGRAPVGVKVLERYLVALRAYLRGEPVQFEDLGFHESIAPDVGTLDLHDTPEHSRLVWIRDDTPVVPVEVAATGPRVIAAAARSADRVVFALGADPERLAWGIETARQARRDAGLDPDDIKFGAYINMVSHPDRQTARELVAGSLTTFARFSVMHGSVSGPATDSQREVFERLHHTYDMKKHTRQDSQQVGALTPEFIDRYALVGPPGSIIDRLNGLQELGISKVIVVGWSSGSDRDAAREAHISVAKEILPAFT